MRRQDAGRAVLLVIQHVPWEGPHRILDACGELDVRSVSPLDGEHLPDAASVDGVLVMGGPMNVDDFVAFPALAEERHWLQGALAAGLPILGICLGAQLLARALGATVSRQGQKEIGFAEVEIHDRADPILGSFAPRTEVLHWHGDGFDLPDGATRLASSSLTETQAFRSANAWGVLFHPEADLALVESWLSEPTMAAEAVAADGEQAPERIRQRASDLEADLRTRSAPGFEAFAALVRARTRS
jgi:GMP synthase (glutamine-hydrolysing)